MNKIQPYAKALAGFLVPFAAQVLAAMQDSSPGGSAITSNEWIAAALTSLVAGGAVYAVPNKDPKATHQLQSVQPPEAGESAVGLVVGVLLVVLLVLLILRLV